MRYPLKDLQLPADKPDPKKLAATYVERALAALAALLRVEDLPANLADDVGGVALDLEGVAREHLS